LQEGGTQGAERSYEDEIRWKQEKIRRNEERLELLTRELDRDQRSEPSMPGGIPDHIWESTRQGRGGQVITMC